METDLREPRVAVSSFPARLNVERSTGQRDRLTVAFRFILGIPHILLVGGPIAGILSWSTGSEGGWEPGWGGGVIGAAAIVAAVISWFAIVFTASQPDGLWKFAAFYLRWRARAVAYLALLRDEYPPFGEGPYPVDLELDGAREPRDRLTVAFRCILVIPHLLALWVLGIVWMLSTIIAWFVILFTGDYPEGLYDFAVGMLRWNLRVESYLLLLHDEYPPFSWE